MWIDSDVGFDDIWAVLTVRHLGARIDGMSLVAGVASLPAVIDNARWAAAAFDWNFPVYEGASSPLHGDRLAAEGILGPGGIRSRERLLPKEAGTRVLEGAFEALCDWLASGTGRRILALGPLTNVSSVLMERPELARRLDCVVWMGGSTGVGNHTPAAEFNAIADPEALQALLAMQIPIRIADLEVCRKVRLTGSDVQRISERSGNSAALLADLAGGYLDIGIERGRDSMAIYDPVAAILLMEPKRFTIHKTRASIDLCGPERGRTSFDAAFGDEGANVYLATDPDREAIRRICIDALLEEAKR